MSKRIDQYADMVQEPLRLGAPQHSVSVAAAITNALGEFLVIRRRDNGRWEPPGGVLELNEGIHQGLIREVREETGLLVEPLKLTGAYKNMSRGIVALVFHCRVLSGVASTSDEVSELSWLTPAQVSARLSPAYAVRLLDVVGHEVPAIRQHDGTNLLHDELTSPCPSQKERTDGAN